jgi:hypothetical protein
MRTLILVTLLVTSVLFSEEQNDVFYSTTLKNGIQVYLKPLNLDDEAISIELAVKNGYASFKDLSPAAYAFSPNVAIESNSTSLFAGQDDAIDLYYSVEAYYSYWILETDALHLQKAIEGLERLLIHPPWNEKAFQIALEADGIKADGDDADKRRLLSLNGMPESILSPYSEATLKSLTLQDTAKAFRNLFTDPSKMILVVSGAFRIEEMKNLLNKTFGSIPSPQNIPEAATQPTPTFPSQPQEIMAGVTRNTDPLIALSFPLPYPLNEDTFAITELVAQVLEESLKHDPSLDLLNPSSINISLELPLYPRLDLPWILVQFQSGQKVYRQEAANVAKAIQERFAKGVDINALKTAREQIDISDSFWRNEPEYWLAFLGNQALMGFSPTQGLLKRKALLTIPLEEVNQKIALFPQNRYTTFISSSKDY